MKITRRQALAGSAASAAALATGVFRPAIAQSEPIRIGYLPALTGPSSSTGIGINRGTELAVKEINAAGGIKGQADRADRPRHAERSDQGGECGHRAHPAAQGARHVGTAELRRGPGGDSADRARRRAPDAPLLGRLADRREEVPDGVPQRAHQPAGRRRRKPLCGEHRQGQEGGRGQRHHGIRHGIARRLRADAQDRSAERSSTRAASRRTIRTSSRRCCACRRRARRPSCPGA